VILIGDGKEPDTSRGLIRLACRSSGYRRVDRSTEAEAVLGGYALNSCRTLSWAERRRVGSTPSVW
jgi:hypothetical protein